MAAAEFQTADDLKAAIGTVIGPSDWLLIDQARIDKFAEATGDFQWIHVDAERAKDGPFGTTIAHGYLTLSLTSAFLVDMLRVPGAKMGINYGTNKVRFPAPVPVDSRVRMSVEIVEVTDVSGGVQVVARNTIEIDGGDKPGCVVDSVSRWLF